MNTRPARVARGLAAAFVAVFVAALSHAAGGGSAPGSVGLVLALAFSAVVCVALAGKSLSIIRLSVSVVFSQLVLHALFTVGASSDATLSVSGMDHLGHGSITVALPGAAAARSAVGVIPAGATSAGATSSVAGGGGNALLDAAASQLCSAMWMAHLVAAIVTIVALRRAEWAFWRLLRLAGQRFTRLVRAIFIEPSPLGRSDRNAGVAERDHLRDPGVYLGWLRHRGPPVCVRFSL